MGKKGIKAEFPKKKRAPLLMVSSGRLVPPFSKGRVFKFVAPSKGEVTDIRVVWDSVEPPSLMYQVVGRDSGNKKFSYRVSIEEEKIPMKAGQILYLMDESRGFQLDSISIDFIFVGE